MQHAQVNLNSYMHVHEYNINSTYSIVGGVHTTLFLFFGPICFSEIPVKITHYASIIFIVYYIATLRKSLCSLQVNLFGYG